MKKKCFVPLFTLLSVLLFPVTVFAGSLNDAEKGIISAISTTYEYNGEYYKVTDGYISQVSGYLSQDGVDLSEEEASEYLSQFYANIGTGISSGYMEKVENTVSSQPKKPTQTEIETAVTEESTLTAETETENVGEKQDKEKTESETKTNAGVIVDNTAGSTQSGKLEYSVTPMDAVMYVWDIDTLDVHEEAYKDSDIIGTLFLGDEVIVTGGATTGWAQIDYNGETGYVSAVYLRTDGFIENLKNETETNGEQITAEEDVKEKETGKDYSGEKAPSKEIKLEILAVGTAAILLIICAVIILLHRNKKR